MKKITKYTKKIFQKSFKLFQKIIIQCKSYKVSPSIFFYEKIKFTRSYSGSRRRISFYPEKRQRLSLTKLLGLNLCTVISGFLIYDGIRNEFVYCGAAKRFCRSLKTAAQIAIEYATLNTKDPEYERKLKEVHQICADRLLNTCLKNGGLYIKVGQGIAAINHILPIEYTSTLAKLQDKCLPTSRKDVQKVFLQELGKLPEEIYLEFDYTPVAAASIAQVFKAKLPSSEAVAVKVNTFTFFNLATQRGNM